MVRLTKCEPLSQVLRFIPDSNYSSNVRFSCTVALLFSLLAARYPREQTNPTHADAKKIVIQVLNGRNNKPMEHKRMSIRLGDNPQQVFRTDSKGDFVLEGSGAEPRELRLWVSDNFYVDCGRNVDDTVAAWETRYSIDEIISKGLAAQNNCGANRASPTPGALIVYTRKMTLKERRLI